MKTCIDSAISTLRKAVDTKRETDVNDMKGPFTSVEKMRDLTEKYTTPASTTIKAQGAMSNCRPWNYSDYLVRLQSFRDMSKWFAKPACLSPLECAAWGWSCHTAEPDSLICHCCGAVLVHNTQEDASGAVMVEQLSSGHVLVCGWHTTSTRTVITNGCTSPDTQTVTVVACDRSFKDIPGLSSPVKTCELTLQRALLLLSAMDTVVHSNATAVQVPMHTSSDSNVQNQQAHLPLQPSAAVLDRIRAQLHTGLRMLSFHTDASISTLANTTLEAPAELTNAVLQLCQIGTQECTDKDNDRDNEVLRAVLLLAVCGWEGTSINGPSAAASTATSTAPIMSCKLCGRCVSLKCPVVIGECCSNTPSAAVDPVSQHRYFCPYVNAPAQWPSWCGETAQFVASKGVLVHHSKDKGGAGSSEPVGWQLVLTALAQLLLSKSHALLIGSVSPGDKVVPGTSGEVGVEEADWCGSGRKRPSDATICDGAVVEPAAAYKRIRNVLDLVVSK